MGETPDRAGRLYKIVRDLAPKALGKRTCPNCHREFPVENFKKVKRGRAWTWLCSICFNNRRPPRRV